MTGARQRLLLLVAGAALFAGCTSPPADAKTPARKSREAEQRERDKEEMLRTQQRPMKPMDNMGH